MDINAEFDKRQADFDALHEKQMEIAKLLVPTLKGKQLDLLVEFVDVSGKLNDLQNKMVDDCCEMIDELTRQNKKIKTGAEKNCTNK